MNGRYARQTTASRANCYRIKVKGTLDPYWSDRLGGLTIVTEDGITTLSGPIVDQASLHGLIMQIRDLGLPLLLVEEINEHQLPVDAKPPEVSLEELALTNNERKLMEVNDTNAASPSA